MKVFLERLLKISADTIQNPVEPRTKVPNTDSSDTRHNDTSCWTDEYKEIASFLNVHYLDFKTETYILLVIVAVGAVGNIISVFVYSHKNMSSPINVIFKALALTDLFPLVIYLVELAHDIQTNFETALRVLNVGSLIFFFLIFRLCALWLTTALTYWRCVALAHPLQSKIRCNSASCRKSVIAVYALSLLINLPFIFLKRANNPSAIERTVDEDGSTFSWLYNHGEVYFWFYRSLLVLLSMTLLMIMSSRLFVHVRRTRSSRKVLPMSSNGRKTEKMIRINKMILTVVILYLVTEFLCIMSCLDRVGLFFIKSEFYTFVDSIRILKLSIYLNPCINTLCYLLMSSQYRNVLRSSIGFSVHSLMSASSIP